MSRILVIEEARIDGNHRFFHETLAAGRILSELTGLPAELAAIGDPNENVFMHFSGPVAATAYAIQHPLLVSYTSDGYTLAFEQLIRKLQPAYVVFPHTYQVRDFAPRLATRFGQVLIGDVTAIEAGPLFTRQLLQGKLQANYRHASDGPCFISIQAGAFRADSASGGTTSISTFEPEIDAAQIRTRPGAPFRAGTQTVDLASAPLIVSVGRGIKEAANLPLVEELAQALGAGACRLLVPSATTAGCQWNGR